jgi:hypothetical protein
VCERLAYADDLDLIGEQLDDVCKTSRKFMQELAHVGLKVKESKTEIRKVSIENRLDGMTRAYIVED